MEFKSVDVLRASDESGLVAEITCRKNDKGFTEFTFRPAREFEQKFDGETKQTSYIPIRAIGSLRTLLDQVENRVKLEQDRLAEQRRVGRTTG